ncbi:ABC transporter permease [Clostridiisalibacter paucivorans]|uniref:ABC transporter permease n=1 Tax=Clostridiisalibacter paucivorans TaxID=408753 RepID=UPI00047EF04B|nr:FtsX-like permease family protein [Clostridiisalibacter paucivorans]
MKIKEYIIMAFSNLRKRRARTFLTSFAISIGVMLIITMLSLGKGVENLIINSLEEFNTVNIISLLPQEYENSKKDDDNNLKSDYKVITENVLKKIANRKEVKDLVVEVSADAKELRIGEKRVEINGFSGIDTNYNVYSDLTLQSARKKENDENLPLLLGGNLIKNPKSHEAVVTESLMKKFDFNKPDEILGKEIDIISDRSQSGIKEEPLITRVKIVGVVNGKVDSSESLFTSIVVSDKVNKFLNRNDKYVYEITGPSNVSVNVKNAQDVKNINNYIKKELGYDTFSMEGIAEIIKLIFTVIKTFLAIGGVIILLVASLGVINTMFMAIYERTRSIGVMKAVGASSSDIKSIFLVESGTIGFLGGILGTIFSIINIQLVKSISIMMLKSKGIEDVEFLKDIFISPVSICIITILFSIIVTILAGLYPSSRAAKLDPIEAIKHE